MTPTPRTKGGEQDMGKELSSSDRALLHAKKRWTELFDMELRHEQERIAFVEGLIPAEQQALIDDADRFSQTNCGWFEYQAMHKAAAEARWMIQRPPVEPVAAGPLP